MRRLFHAMLLTVMISARAFAAPAHVEVKKSSAGWHLLVDGRPMFVKGLCYVPVKVGESPSLGTQQNWMRYDENKDGINDVAYQSWVDTNGNNFQDSSEPAVGDFQLMKQLGCNAIRVYHHASDNQKINLIHRNQPAARKLYSMPPDKKLLRDLYRTYGIRIAMGDLLGAYGVGSGATWEEGTDYTNKQQLENMMASVIEMVQNHKDEDYLLLWVLGNENNLKDFTKTNAAQQPEAYAKFLNKVARHIKKMDPHHPVCVSNGEVKLMKAYADFAPDIDIFGINSYRKDGFGSLWNTVAQKYDKPVLLTEYGVSHPVIRSGKLDQKAQSKSLASAYCDTLRHSYGEEKPQNSIGGFLYEWLDNWWQNGDEWNPNLSETEWNNEITGLAGQGSGSNSPFQRNLRDAYFDLQKLWKSEASSCSRN